MVEGEERGRSRSVSWLTVCLLRQGRGWTVRHNYDGMGLKGYRL